MDEKEQDNMLPVDQQNHEMEQRYAEYREILKELTIMSDIFMRNVLNKKECIEYVLQTILREPVLVLEQVVQKDYKNLQGRSAVLDCVARDNRNRQMNVEIQQEKDGATPKRARYHSGLVDMNTLNPGQKFEELPENYVIFITRTDILGEKRQIYHIDRRIRESGKVFGDDTYIIYVNAGMQDDTEVGKLVHDLHCKDAKDIYSQVLAKRVYELKETQEGIEIMCKEMDQVYNWGIEHERKRAELKSANVARLTTVLLKAGRVEDCLRAANDAEYQSKLMKELDIA